MIIKELEWLKSKLQNVLIEMNEREWYSLEAEHYYGDAIQAITQEIDADIRDEQDRKRETAF